MYLIPYGTELGIVVTDTHPTNLFQRKMHWKAGNLVSDTMINNCYRLMKAVDSWELDTPMPFAEFIEKIFNDKNFARKHAPRGKMDEEDYNPWAST